MGLRESAVWINWADSSASPSTSHPRSANKPILPANTLPYPNGLMWKRLTGEGTMRSEANDWRSLTVIGILGVQWYVK